MKIPGSIQRKYDDQVDLYGEIGERVQSIISSDLEETWHFEGRLKGAISFAQKVETGMFDADGLEDFYACTLVVPTMGALEKAERRINERFNVVRRKPAEEGLATSQPINFPFDHIRLYAALRVPPGLPGGPVFERVFEIQIKTYLQHAWSIATHDLTYKASEVSWGTQRVAAQVKATLEAAEISIVEAVRLAGTGNRLLAREDQETRTLRLIQGDLRSEFDTPQLPEDMRRLAMTINGTMTALGMSPARLGALLQKGRRARGGAHPTNLSPYGVIVHYLVQYNASRLKRALQRKGGLKIFVPPEVELPAAFSDRPLVNLSTVLA